eukprot:scaffold17345_cov88-Skeletonema_dohrnii-CCMP3373.AAC.1
MTIVTSASTPTKNASLKTLANDHVGLYVRLALYRPIVITINITFIIHHSSLAHLPSVGSPSTATTTTISSSNPNPTIHQLHTPPTAAPPPTQTPTHTVVVVAAAAVGGVWVGEYNNQQQRAERSRGKLMDKSEFDR